MSLADLSIKRPTFITCIIIIMISVGLFAFSRLGVDLFPNVTFPVVVVTTSEQENDVMESYKLGANSYIVKPVNFDKFVQAVTELGFYWMLLNKPPH